MALHHKTASVHAHRREFLSPAKVNLFLKVLSKRPDGYHEICSLMQPVSLYDRITIELKDGAEIEVTATGNTVPGGKDNLAYRAAELFFEAAGANKSASIAIEKNIPAGAGLGGGSSDAATVLMGLNEMTRTELSQQRLMDLGALIGSDVPFFMLKGPALATGRGEVLKKAAIPEYEYVLINPGFQVSTAWVYNNLDLTKKPQHNILTYSEEALKDVQNIRNLLVNDLEAVTLQRYPEISRLKQTLIDTGAAGALMSGSGPTVFGIYRDRDAAVSACERLKASLGGKFFVFMARGLRAR